MFAEQEFAKSIMRAAEAAKSCVAQQVKVCVCAKHVMRVYWHFCSCELL